MSNQDQSWKTQPRVSPCKTCDILIFWNSPLQIQKGEKFPYNLSGTAPHVHNDPNEKYVSDEQKAMKASLKPPAGLQAPAPAPAPSIVSNPISTSYTPSQQTDTLMAMVHELQELRAQITALTAMTNEVFPLLKEWMRYNPIQAAQTEFIAKIFNKYEDMLQHFGPIPASDLKTSMNSDSVNPLPPS
jgi:hypothetical protein